MSKRIIQVCYRKMIDQHAAKAWEKFVFEDSYTEFLMQVQFYNQEKKYFTFGELVRNVPGAEKLHFLVSSAVIGYISQLHGLVPDVVNTLGRQFLKFTNYRFEIINSDTRNKSAHQVAINFFSEPMLWHETIGEYLVVSPVAQIETDSIFITDTFALSSMTSICSLKTVIE